MSMALIIPGTITWEVTFGEIIESIAKEESSLSHILNAGSKKNHGGCGESQRQCRAGDRDQPFGEECHWRNLPSENDAIGEAGAIPADYLRITRKGEKLCLLHMQIQPPVPVRAV